MFVLLSILLKAAYYHTFIKVQNYILQWIVIPIFNIIFLENECDEFLNRYLMLRIDLCKTKIVLNIF